MTQKRMTEAQMITMRQNGESLEAIFDEAIHSGYDRRTAIEIMAMVFDLDQSQLWQLSDHSLFGR